MGVMPGSCKHIPRRYENIFVENIQKNSKVGVVLSWAGLSQPGVGHENNREQGYVKKNVSFRISIC